MVEIIPFTKYRVRNFQAGTYLTRSFDDNTSVVCNQLVGTTGQEWIFDPTGPDMYFLRSADANQIVSVQMDQVFQGQQLQCSVFPFAWRFIDVPDMDSAVRITPVIPNPDLYVDLWEGAVEDGTKVQLWPMTGNNQVWVLERAQD